MMNFTKGKKKTALALILALFVMTAFAGCGTQETAETAETVTVESEIPEEAVKIVLSDDGITMDGEPVTEDETAAVYIANDILYYEEGHDETYGEGTEADAHSAEEAAAHTVVHITEPGVYALSGKLSQGQILVDLGSDAEEDPEAVVLLALDGVDITCTVAPAILFTNVYECGSTDTETATMDVNTISAGANVLINAGTVNTVNGSYVAKIYKSYTVAEDGTITTKKLAKYDGALYSKKSMNIYGNGTLNVNAENEGIDSELHLTINEGTINIVSGNDGINTNEDGVSVTTINGGQLTVTVTGTTGEGDGIDSNGWLVINGGTVTSYACSFSGDNGVDADNGIYINGGTVIATGNMYDAVDGGQNYAVFAFASSQSGGTEYTLKNADGTAILDITPVNSFTYLVYSSEALTEGDYTLSAGDTRLAGSKGTIAFGGMGMEGGMGGFDPNETGEAPELPEGVESGTMPTMPDGQNGQGGNAGGTQPTMPDGQNGNGFNGQDGQNGSADGTTPPEKPDGDTSSNPGNGGQNGQDGTMPNGQNGQGGNTDGTMPTMPDEQNGNGFNGQGGTMPDGQGENADGTAPEIPEGGMGGQGGMNFGEAAEASATFTIEAGGNFFTNVQEAEEAEGATV